MQITIRKVLPSRDYWTGVTFNRIHVNTIAPNSSKYPEYDFYFPEKHVDTLIDALIKYSTEQKLKKVQNLKKKKKKEVAA